MFLMAKQWLVEIITLEGTYDVQIFKDRINTFSAFLPCFQVAGDKFVLFSEKLRRAVSFHNVTQNRNWGWSNFSLDGGALDDGELMLVIIR
jgi:hypothetical protein